MVLEEILENMQERRQYERVPKKIGIRYGVFDDLAKILTDREGKLLDLGAGGLRFLAEEPLEISSQVMLNLEFPGWHEGEIDWRLTFDESDVGVLKIVGMVVRCMPSSHEPDKYEVAVCFCGRMKK